MTSIRYCLLAAVTLSLSQLHLSAQVAPDAAGKPIVSLRVLEAAEHQQVNAKPRVQLAEISSAEFQGIDGVESGSVPNYLRALAPMPGAAKAFAHLTRTLLLGGVLDPETKMAMGLRMAQVHDAPYVAAHMERLLQASERGRALLAAMQAGHLDSVSPADRLALRYAEDLTHAVHGVSDAEFVTVRGYFNDAQL